MPCVCFKTSEQRLDQLYLLGRALPACASHLTRPTTRRPGGRVFEAVSEVGEVNTWGRASIVFREWVIGFPGRPRFQSLAAVDYTNSNLFSFRENIRRISHIKRARQLDTLPFFFSHPATHSLSFFHFSLDCLTNSFTASTSNTQPFLFTSPFIHLASPTQTQNKQNEDRRFHRPSRCSLSDRLCRQPQLFQPRRAQEARQLPRNHQTPVEHA